MQQFEISSYTHLVQVHISTGQLRQVIQHELLVFYVVDLLCHNVVIILITCTAMLAALISQACAFMRGRQAERDANLRVMEPLGSPYDSKQ
jgi:hypothetical protein